MTSWIDLYKLADIIFGTTQKPLYITSSNLIKNKIKNKVIILKAFW